MVYMSVSDKIKETIEKIYYDPGGFGTIYETYKDAKAKNKWIKLSDVKTWFETNVERKTQLRGYSSYVSKGPLDEFEIDLFFSIILRRAHMAILLAF